MRHGRRRYRWLGVANVARVAALAFAGASASDVAVADSNSPTPAGPRGVHRSASSAAGAVRNERLRRRLTVATFMNSADRHYAYLQVSAEAHSMHPRILGYGMEAWWPDGLGVKINSLRDYVMKEIADDDVLLFADAFDVIFFADEHEVLKRFDALERQFNKSLVFNAEQYCYPPDEKGGDGVCDPTTYPQAPHRWRYLNSGLMIGRGWAYRRMLRDRVSNVIKGSDQKWYQQYFRGHQDMIHLDTDCYVVCAVTGDNAENGVEFSAGQLSIPETGNSPAIVHFVSVAHWVDWRNGVPTSALHEVFRRLYPAQADRLLDRWNIGADLGTTHSAEIYRGPPWLAVMRTVLCLQCNALGSRHHECMYFPSLFDSQCLYAQVVLLSGGCVISMSIFLLLRTTRLRSLVSSWSKSALVTVSTIATGIVLAEGKGDDDVLLSAPPPGRKGSTKRQSKADNGGPGQSPPGISCSPVAALPSPMARVGSGVFDRMELGVFAHKKRG